MALRNYTVTVTDDEGQEHEITVQADCPVMAAGAAMDQAPAEGIRPAMAYLGVAID